MKNKKGFTLIELLAIIAILAVIMVIAVPQIIKMFSNSTDNTWNNSVNGIENALSKNIQVVNPITGKYKYTVEEFCSNPSKLDEIVDYRNIDITCSNNTFTLKGKGQLDGKTAMISCENKKCSVIRNSKVDDDINLASGLYDDNNNLLASWDELVNDYGMNLEPTDVHYYTYYTQSEVDNMNIGEAGWYEYIEDEEVHINISDIQSDIPAFVLAKFRKGTTLVIDSKIGEIPHGAFYGSMNLKKVIIQNGITKIGDRAFFSCEKLESIYIPESVTEIGGATFWACANLKNVNIPSKLTMISPEMFNGCTSLESIKIPEGVTIIDDFAFAGTGIRNIALPETLVTIGEGAFAESKNLRRLSIPKKVDWIHERAFVNNYLEEINVNKNNIEYSSQNGVLYNKDKTILLAYPSMKISYNIPNGVKRIGDYAFEGCPIAITISIPSSVTKIGYWAFMNDNTASIVVDNDNPIYDSRDNCNCIIETAKNELIVGTPKTVIPKSVTSIGEEAFYGSKIKSLTIPNGVKEIGNYAFASSKLTSITIPDSLISIGNGAFTGSKLTSITIPNSLTSIGSHAFTRTELTSAVFKNSNNWKAETIELNGSDLLNQTTAAEYLREVYNKYKWTRSN